jgi:hypothetical protein
MGSEAGVRAHGWNFGGEQAIGRRKKKKKKKKKPGKN